MTAPGRALTEATRRTAALVELLAALGERTVAEREARNIHAAILSLGRGYEIGKDRAGFYARPRRARPEGPARALRDLAAAARKAINGKNDVETWMEVWAAQSVEVGRLCRPALLKSGRLDPAKLLGHFSAPGFTMVIPKPEAVLPCIEAELHRLKGQTGGRVRKPDASARDVIAVVRAAYAALTGKSGGRVNRSDGAPSRFVRLGRDIDTLFGTKIFPRVDSARLKTGDKNPF